jgi:hypothetical protein
MRALRRTAPAAVALLVTLSGCTGDDGGERPPEPTTTPLSGYDTGSVTVARGAFCDLLDDAAVEQLLGGEPERERAWGDGDELPFGEGDVGHEWGCDVTGPDGETLRAWVFAPPVTDDRARELAAGLRSGSCRPLPDAPRVGSPGAAVDCRLDGGARLVRFAGLVGDAWLTCELYAPREVEGTRAELAERTGRWCVTVLEAAASGE